MKWVFQDLKMLVLKLNKIILDEYFSLIKSDVYGHQIVTFTVDPRTETV